MILGQYYQVPAVRVDDFHGFDGWMPVNTPEHEDAEVINYPWQHFHVDWRFAPTSVWKYLSIWHEGSRIFGSVVMRTKTNGVPQTVEGPTLKRMKYKRELPPYPHDIAPWTRRLAEQFACSKLIDGKCPHRGTPVSAMIREGDILTCPAHGLRWNAITGLPHTSGGTGLPNE